MKLWLICATIYEAETIIEHYKLEKIEWPNNIQAYINNDIVLVISGIGKIMATIWISYLVNNFDYKYIINIWIVWACKEKWNIGDILLVNQIIQYDVVIPFRNKYTNVIYNPIKLTLQNDKKKYIICATWDKVINEDKKKELWNKLNIDIVDMESFAIWRYMKEFWILENLIVIKWVSDDLQWWYKVKYVGSIIKKICTKIDKYLLDIK